MYKKPTTIYVENQLYLIKKEKKFVSSSMIRVFRIKNENGMNYVMNGITILFKLHANVINVVVPNFFCKLERSRICFKY